VINLDHKTAMICATATTTWRVQKSTTKKQNWRSHINRDWSTWHSFWATIYTLNSLKIICPTTAKSV